MSLRSDTAFSSEDCTAQSDSYLHASDELEVLSDEDIPELV